MSQMNLREVVMCGDRSHYYSYDGELYTVEFPQEWAANHLPKTGPADCTICNKVGSWNGVFIGYCTDCAKKYEGKRGLGMKTNGVENSVDELINEWVLDHSICAYDTYLKTVDLDLVGDKEFLYDSFKQEALRFDLFVSNSSPIGNVRECLKDWTSQFDGYCEYWRNEINKATAFNEDIDNWNNERTAAATATATATATVTSFNDDIVITFGEEEEPEKEESYYSSEFATIGKSIKKPLTDERRQELEEALRNSTSCIQCTEIISELFPYDSQEDTAIEEMFLGAIEEMIEKGREEEEALAVAVAAENYYNSPNESVKFMYKC